MSSGETPNDLDTLRELETLRGLVAHATQRLLGDTIEITDEQWHTPSRLPGWNRAQVATHVARQADGLTRLATWARTGERQEMYGSEEQRTIDIDAGRARSGLELQIDLDESAGRLSDAFEALDEPDRWSEPVQLRNGREVPARVLPLGRLSEVVLHHVDLDIGWGVDDIDAQSAGWLLEWCARRLKSRDDFPALSLIADEGTRVTIGDAQPTTVTGPANRLLGWLTSRSDTTGLTGADEITLPAY